MTLEFNSGADWNSLLVGVFTGSIPARVTKTKLLIKFDI